MTEEQSTYRSGFAAFLGKPNAGKSTLLNKLVGEKLAAVSPLPQTTRDRFAGIYNDDNRQIVFVDLPGLITPTDRINEYIRQNVIDGIEGIDVVVHLVDVSDHEPLLHGMGELLTKTSTPMILAINKIDGKQARVDAGSWAGEKLPKEIVSRYRAILGISAQNGTGREALLDAITELLKPGPPLYDPEILTDRDMRYLAQEMIREKVFLYLHEELPYSIAVEIEEFQERENEKWYISAFIYVERESQKGIVIGKAGASLRKISTAARQEIERLCDASVFLELRVKVLPKWRKNERDLRRFGYTPPKQKKKKKGR